MDYLKYIGAQSPYYAQIMAGSAEQIPVITGQVIGPMGPGEASLLLAREPSHWQLVPQASSATISSLIAGWAQDGSYTLTSVTYDSTYTNAVSTASVVWPDGSTGTFTATSINATFGTVDAYTITYVQGGTTMHTATQAAVTRNSDGLIIAQPAITVS